MAVIILLVHDLKMGDILQVLNLLNERDSEHKIVEMVGRDISPGGLKCNASPEVSSSIVDQAHPDGGQHYG